MTNDSSITVAIPTYRRCKKVKALVNSILPQLLSDDEIVVIDDGSNDGTDQALANTERVRVISNPSNEGMVKTWNKCLISAQNTWICTIHDDDSVFPKTLESIRKAITLASDPSLIGHCYSSSDEKDLNFRCRVIESGKWSALHPIAIPSGATIHRDIINSVGLFDETFKYSADIEFFSRISSKFTTIVIENPCILTFNLHGQNHEFKTWREADFFSQLEEIEKKIVNYSDLGVEEAKNYFNQKMNDYVRYMLKNSRNADDKKLSQKIGMLVKDKPYLRKKTRISAQVAALTNWPLDL